MKKIVLSSLSVLLIWVWQSSVLAMYPKFASFARKERNNNSLFKEKVYAGVQFTNNVNRNIYALWQPLKLERHRLGTMVKFQQFVQNNTDFHTAELELRKGSTGFLNRFGADKPENMDTVTLSKMGNISMFNIGFQYSWRIRRFFFGSLWADISADLAGVSMSYPANNYETKVNGEPKQLKIQPTANNLRKLGAANIGNLSTDIAINLEVWRFQFLMGFNFLVKEIQLSNPNNVSTLAKMGRYNAHNTGLMLGARFRF